MTLSELKIGKMYVSPKNTKVRFVWLEPDQTGTIFAAIKQNMPFVLLAHNQDQSSSKVLTSNGIVGWINWELEVYVNENSFQEAKP